MKTGEEQYLELGQRIVDEEVSMLEATDVVAECPHCHEKVGNFLIDPRGHEVNCEFCEKSFKIHNEADIEMGI